MIHLSRKPLAAVRELAAIVLLGVAAACASAQTGWPNKPVRIVVPYGAGSSPDVMARLMGDRLSARLGRPDQSSYDTMVLPNGNPAHGG